MYFTTRAGGWALALREMLLQQAHAIRLVAMLRSVQPSEMRVAIETPSRHTASSTAHACHAMDSTCRNGRAELY